MPLKRVLSPEHYACVQMLNELPAKKSRAWEPAPLLFNQIRSSLVHSTTPRQEAEGPLSAFLTLINQLNLIM